MIKTCVRSKVNMNSIDDISIMDFILALLVNFQTMNYL